MTPVLTALLSGIVLGGLLALAYKALRASRHYVPRGQHEKVQASLVEAERLLSVERERSERTEAQLRERTAEWRRAEEERTAARESLAAGKAEQVLLRERLEALRGDLERARADHREELDRANALQRECDTLAEQGRSGARILEAQKEEVARVQQELRSEFQVLASSLLEEKSRKFTEQNRESIEALLKPLGENIAGFKKQVEEAYQKESNERFSLGKEVEKLHQLNQRLSEEANSLVNALKGNSKVQGDWGQMILENILERSGLRRGLDFSVQEFLRDADGNTLKNEDGGKLQPDAMVHFPDNRKVLIDAKVSLTAYVRLTEAGSDEERAAAMAEHMRSVKRHIDELSAKNYPDFAASLDFVMMFVPSEPAYSCALGQDPELWHYAYGKRILLINPTNLIVALKMAADLWRRENQARNHLEIAERGAALYEKFVGFVEHLKLVGAGLRSATANYEKALGQLSEGKGNLVRQAEMLRELGVKTKKSIPQDILAQASDLEPAPAAEGDPQESLPA